MQNSHCPFDAADSDTAFAISHNKFVFGVIAAPHNLDHVPRTSNHVRVYETVLATDENVPKQSRSIVTITKTGNDQSFFILHNHTWECVL